MARMERKKSSTGIYHVMTRGIDKRNIFLDNYDKINYIQDLIKTKEKYEFDLYAYCLMNNHVHLLIGDKSDLGKIMQSLNVRFARRNNNKYERTGHLFQNRYLSEPVEDMEYFTCVVRYIHNNPVKAAYCAHPKNYRFSSYNDYITSYDGVKTGVETGLLKNYLKTKYQFMKFSLTEDNHNFLEIKSNSKFTDTDLLNFISEKYNILAIQEMSKIERNAYIKDIYEYAGVSIRQLSRVLGVGKKIIEKALK